MTKKAVAVVIEDDEGRILLTQRGRISRDEYGTWENCGGAVDEGETKEDAIKREVKEELGANLEIMKTLYSDTFTTKSGANWEVTIYKGGLLEDPKIINYDENSGFGWFSKRDLKHLNLASYTRKDFEKFGWIK